MLTRPPNRVLGMTLSAGRKAERGKFDPPFVFARSGKKRVQEQSRKITILPIPKSPDRNPKPTSEIRTKNPSDQLIKKQHN